MSHIPNSAMPHAAPTAEAGPEQAASPTLAERAGRLADKARANPKTAAAAGAAVVAGAIAAIAIPAVRAARKKSDGKSAPKSAKKKA